MPRTYFLAALTTGLILCSHSAYAADDDKALGSDGCNHTDARAGNPRETSRCAALGNTCEYFGYWVGGSCSFRCKGSEAGPDQGTYGWDYGGHAYLPKPKIVLNFCNCYRYKGGIGAYETDKGPPVLNIFGLKLPERHEDHPPELKCQTAKGAPCK